MKHKYGLYVKVFLVVMTSVFGTTVVARAAERVRTVAGDSRFMRRSDAAIKIDVARALKADWALLDSWIVVKSVRNGVVRLSGNAASSNDIVRALRLTADRRGVRRVFSEIQAMTDFPSMSAAGAVGITIEPGSSVHDDPALAEDDEIRRGVERVLNDQDASGNAGIRVRVTDGVVWLTGSVSSWQGNSARLEAARSVTGVRSIINELHVATLSADRR